MAGLLLAGAAPPTRGRGDGERGRAGESPPGVHLYRFSHCLLCTRYFNFGRAFWQPAAEAALFQPRWNKCPETLMPR